MERILVHACCAHCLGKLLTGQDFGGDAKKCMDTIAAAIDAAVADAGL